LELLSVDAQGEVSRITVIDVVPVALFHGLPASASRPAVAVVGTGSGSLSAPSLIERCPVRSGHQGPVLDVLATLAAKGGCAWLRLRTLALVG